MEDEYIRPPDEIKREKIIDNDSDMEEYIPRLDELISHSSRNMLSLSEEELHAISQKDTNQYSEDTMYEILEKSEREYLEKYEKEKQNRQKKFMNVKKQIQKILGLDKVNNHIFILLLDAFTLYEEEGLEHYPMDMDTYNKIEKLLYLMRITKTEMKEIMYYLAPISISSNKTSP
jgi:hypothetical protein